jgi:hypothetical protein
MLGAEERHELHAGRVSEKISSAAALRVQAGVIGDQTDVFAAQWGKFSRFEDVQTHLDSTGSTRAFLSGSEARRRK